MTGKHFSAIALSIFIFPAFALTPPMLAASAQPQPSPAAQPQPMAATALTQSTPAASAQAQPQQQKQPEDKSKRPSPPGTADCTINGKKVTIEYSRPSLKGRKLGTDLAPYGKVWRTGAN